MKKLHLSKRFLIITGVILLVLGAFMYFRLNSKEQPPQFATVKKQDLKSTVASSGTIASKQAVNLKFKSSGRLAYLNFKEGDSIYQGQVIAGLDSKEQSINLQQAQNTLRERQATLEKVLDDIHLFQYGNGGFSNVGSPNETQAQRQTRIVAEVASDNAYDSLKSAQRAFEDVTLISPVNGIIIQLSPVVGENITATETIARVVDTSDVEFDAEIDESDIAKVLPGQKAEVTLNASPDEVFSGEVSKITQNTKTTSSGATIVIVKIKLTKAPKQFIEGLNGQATIVTKELKNVLAIPQDALLDGKNVLIKRDGSLETKAIETGFSSDADIEVIMGLSEGEEVVINPSSVQKK